MLEVLRSGQLSLGPRVAEFERAFAERVGAPLASAVSSGTAGLHLALRAVGVGEGDEVITSPFSFVASANVGAVRARAAGVRRHRPADAEPRPAGRRRRGHASARARCCRCTSSATPPTCPRSSGSPRGTAWRSSRTPARRSARVHADGTPVGGRGHPAVFGFYANKQLTTGEGGMVTLADAAHEGAHRLRAQPGPRARHGLARPRPARLQLPPLGHRLRARHRPARAPGGDARRARARRRAATARRWRGSRGSSCRAPTRTATRAAGSCSSCSCPAASTATRRSARSPRAGIQSKPYLPAIHLMSFYRERFGHREGEFPVCEDVAARSLALPFFPQMSEGQVARVAEARWARRCGRAQS